MSEWTERAHLLKPGQRYRVTRDVPPGLSSFAKGEVLTFKDAGYSRYDSSYFYSFLDGSGGLKSFALHDDRPTEWLTDTFAVALAA